MNFTGKKKNLLLEGIPGCGKSTAIYTALKELDLLKNCGGFHTARVFGTDGKLRGFAQFPAAEEAGVNLCTDAPVPRMFLDFAKCPPLQEEVFRKFTVKSLEAGKIPEAGSDEPFSLRVPTAVIEILLMDEIGGRELEIPEVYEAFLSVLKGPLPVIGVLKCPEHAKHFAFDTYQRFRRQLEKETDTEVCEMSALDREETIINIRKWLLLQKESAADKKS